HTGGRWPGVPRPRGEGPPHVSGRAHPGRGAPPPDRGGVGGERPLNNPRRDGLVLGDAGAGQPGDQARLHDAEAARHRDGSPMIEARVMTTRIVAMLACCPTACSEAPSALATSSWASTEPVRM